MTTGHKISVSALALVIVLLVVGSVVGTYMVMSERQRVAVAQEKSNAANDLIKSKNEVITQKDGDIAKRDEAFSKFADQTNRNIAAVKSSADAATELAKRGFAFKPQTDTTGKPTGDYVASSSDLIPLYGKLATCDLREAELGICKKDLDDTKTKFTVQKTNLETMTKDRDQWQQTAKGGTKLQRTWFAVKVGACGGAGAAPGALIKDPKVAMGGAAIAALTCAIFARK
jgi:hypothetical protein